MNCLRILRQYARDKRTLSAPIVVMVLLRGLVAAEASCGEEKDNAEKMPSELRRYVDRPDPTFAWHIKEKSARSEGQLYRVELTSQTWEGGVWRHDLNIHEPKHLEYPQHLLLYITGGDTSQPSGEDSIQRGFLLAQLTGARVAVLHQVPNQPLLGNHREDDLISETWLRYLDSGDADWPLLFPMVKSAVRAMDAIEAIAKSEWHGSVAGFVVTGASKRGWTTWLTAAADKRVVAIAPMVIDMLNMRPQMKYQMETWGKYSESIAPYSRRGLTNTDDETARRVQLRRMMDPYSYRSVLSMPKLLIHGTNDPYWVVDATQLYWDGLVGPKYMLKVPNGGHGFDPRGSLSYNTMAAFFRHVIDKTPLPELQWSEAESEGELHLNVKVSTSPASARLWTAQSATKDFRHAQWQSQPLENKQGEFIADIPKPQQGHIAFFGQLQFQMHGEPYYLTTLVWRY
jgi:PhoPQ-activated pathogenicity-related protein